MCEWRCCVCVCVCIRVFVYRLMYDVRANLDASTSRDSEAYLRRAVYLASICEFHRSANDLHGGIRLRRFSEIPSFSLGRVSLNRDPSNNSWLEQQLRRDGIRQDGNNDKINFAREHHVKSQRVVFTRGKGNAQKVSLGDKTECHPPVTRLTRERSLRKSLQLSLSLIARNHCITHDLV